MLLTNRMAMRRLMRVGEIKSAVDVSFSPTAVLDQRVQGRAEPDCTGQHQADGEIRSNELSESQLQSCGAILPL